MEYAYDTLTGRLIVHVDGSDSPSQRLIKWRTAFESTGWQPGGTVMFSAAIGIVAHEMAGLNQLVEILATHGVRRAAMLVRDGVGKDTADTAVMLLKAHGIPARRFMNLQVMFDWINEEIEDETKT